jgi:AAA family ATP:ADP antiporter
VAKYKAKQAVDSFFMRAGDVLQAGIVFVGERLAFTVPAFAVVNVAMALGWIGIVAALNPAYRAQIDSTRQTPEAKGDAVSSAPVAVQRPREAIF